MDGPDRPPERAPARLRKLLRGDLDNIVLKALRKDPESRYASVLQLAEDIRRKVLTVPGVNEVDVEIVFSPPWSSAMMSDAARLQLGLM